MKKKYLFFIFIFFGTLVYSQKNTPNVEDTSKLCIPYSVAQRILIDLNDYDRLKEVTKTYQNEILLLNKKTDILIKENQSWEKQDKLNNQIISEKNDAISIVKTENEDLKKENKRLKTKNGLYNIISAVIIAPLTYIAIFK